MKTSATLPRAIVLCAVALLALTSAVLVIASDGSAGDEERWAAHQFTGSPAEIDAFIAYYKAIELTSEQEQVRVDALSEMPAPCCSNFSAATCCCECNLSRSLWGLSKYLITEHGAGPADVRAAVEAWVAAINPDGYSGEVCMSGGCGRPFKKDGCGGMSDQQISY